MKNRVCQRIFSIVFLVAVTSGILSPARAHAEEGYPLRAKYSALKTISTDDFAKIYDDVLIVDSRSAFEYDVMHIKRSVNIPVSNMLFLSELEKNRSKDDLKKIVFYCNGHSCDRSYEAGRQADAAGFKNFVIYDSGIFDWVAAHPEKSEFFGESPVAKSSIIERSVFQAHNLPYAKFKVEAEKEGAMAIDVRDPIQRKFVPAIKGLRSIPLDKLMPALLTGHFKDQKLHFIDEVDKQNEWLEYYLVKFGYKSYSFLEGGAEAAPR